MYWYLIFNQNLKPLIINYVSHIFSSKISKENPKVTGKCFSGTYEIFKNLIFKDCIPKFVAR